MKRLRLMSLFAVIFGSLIMFGCATMSESPPTDNNEPLFAADSPPSQSPQPNVWPPFKGEPVRAQVIKFGLEAEVENKYPELKAKRIGWGLCNRIVDNLFDTGRFIFIEEKEAIVKRIFQQLSQSSHAMYDQNAVPKPGKQSLPDYYLYAEVYDFAITPLEKVTGLSVTQRKKTRIGVQIRMTNVATGTYIPGSGTGEAVSEQKRPMWSATAQQFDQSTVGIASERAIRNALISLLKRWNAQLNH